jgi:hypothetical protein
MAERIPPVSLEVVSLKRNADYSFNREVSMLKNDENLTKFKQSPNILLFEEKNALIKALMLLGVLLQKHQHYRPISASETVFPALD